MAGNIRGVGGSSRGVETTPTDSSVPARDLGRAAESGRGAAVRDRELPADSVSTRGGRAQIAEAGELGRGQAVTPELLAELRTLGEAFSGARGTRAQRADIDVPINATSSDAVFDVLMAPATLSAVGSAFGSMGDMFADAQQQMEDALNSFSAMIETGFVAQADAIGTMMPGVTLDPDDLLPETVADIREYIETLPPLVPGPAPVGEGPRGSGGAGGPAAPGPTAPVLIAFQPNPELQKFLTNNKNIDVNALVQWVLRESYMENCADLRAYADKVKFYNEMKKQIRDEATRAREFMAQMAGKSEDAELPEPFGTEEFDTNYFTGGASMSSDPEVLAAAQQAMDDRRAAQENLAAEQRAYAEMEPIMHSVSGTSIGAPERSELINNGEAGPQTSRADIDNEVSRFADEWVSWFQSLPQDQQDAIVRHLQTEGLTVRGQMDAKRPGGLYDHRNDPIASNNLTLPNPCNDPVAAIGELLRTAGGQAVDADYSIHSRDGALCPPGGNIDLWSLSLEVDLGPSIQMPERPDKPQSLLDAEAAAGVSSTSGAWTSGQPCMTKADLDAYIKTLEEKLNSTGDDAQLANVDLQNSLQKQQQTLQMMSNISKMLHDTALAVIRKIGG